MSTQKILTTTTAIICLLALSFFLYQKYSVKTVSYSGLGITDYDPSLDGKQGIIINNSTSTFNLRNSDKIEFLQRKITGGGVNPGWVISLLETQPNIFTGRVIVDDGVYQHPVTVKEESKDIFIGEMKSKDGRKDIFSMKKENKQCVDEEKNTFEYSLSGTYGATQFLGCGGTLLKPGN